MRFHNQGLQFERLESEDETPTFTVYDFEGGKVDTFGAAILNQEQIFERIMDLDQKINDKVSKNLE